ncbi:hypothetical protein AVEN_144005-1 [Araneus ventricosus]|uniref:Uncharacterized protein n=1 Tax=Araneus ventricosus TaxID=182803 RepID=A0A4Y2D1Z9_ARAVE|nr:hypothetical protein AVEN_2070-1 [Araneus ventricosus]GBM09988.1 hypothetical protein AVEN_79982-1 [Araneus ventricosus]GBM09993.1 hypothetical protein AVEN_138009-1 [Araneus ventricosus]GBM09998.1 hypothetical protein AVEN_144005-1 [Araneus ventricosus]
MLKARYTHSSKDPTWRLFTHVTGNFQSKSKAARSLWGKECRYLRDVFRALSLICPIRRCVQRRLELICPIRRRVPPMARTDMPHQAAHTPVARTDMSH